MTNKNLRLLQLNIMKSRAGMEALINNPQTQNLDILLIQEPSITTYRTHVNHRAWRLYPPMYEDEAVRKRSLLYIDKMISTSLHRQIRCKHPDITTVKIWTTKIQMLIFSVYIPPTGIYQTPDEISIQSTLDKIQYTIQRTTQTDNRPTKVILAGDFNHHHPT